MLDKRLTYTCGYWKNAKNLDEAQEAKFDLVCKKIGLKPGQKVLDIGSGWGSFIGCGDIIYYFLPGYLAQEKINCGRLYCLKKECWGDMNQ